jgi:hypothetical protein
MRASPHKGHLNSPEKGRPGGHPARQGQPPTRQPRSEFTHYSNNISLLTRYRNRETWPAITGIVAAAFNVQAKDTLDPRLSYTILMESTVALSYDLIGPNAEAS